MGARLYHSSLSVPPWPPREIHTHSPRTLPLFSVLYSRRPTTRRGPRPLLGVNGQRRSWDAAARPPGRGRAGTVSLPGMLASLGWGPITPRSASVSPLCSGGATPRWRGAARAAGTSAALRPASAGRRTAHLSRWGSPVQVEGGDLRIVSLVVREVKKVRGRLLLSRLPRENGAKQRARALRTPSGGRLVPARERRLLDFQEFCEPVLTQSSLGTV